jgi:hypothetical protein
MALLTRVLVRCCCGAPGVMPQETAALVSLTVPLMLLHLLLHLHVGNCSKAGRGAAQVRQRQAELPEVNIHRQVLPDAAQGLSCEGDTVLPMQLNRRTAMMVRGTACW